MGYGYRPYLETYGESIDGCAVESYEYQGGLE